MRVQGYGLRVKESSTRVAFRFMVKGLSIGFRVKGSGFRVPGSEFRVLGSGYRVVVFALSPKGAGCTV